MNIPVLFKSGTIRSLRTWKGVLVIWIVTLFLAWLAALPLKASINSFLGKSMITEMLHNGLTLDFVADLGPLFNSLVSSFSAGLFLVIVSGYLLSIFFAGGIFQVLKEDQDQSMKGFFSGASVNFRSFFVITVITTLLIIVLFIVVFILPSMIISNIESPAEGLKLKIRLAALSAFFLLLPFPMLLADTSRAWNARSGRNAGFAALGKGFSLTFRRFFASYAVMLLLLVIQFIFGIVVYRLISGFHPSTGAGILLLFLLSQLLFVTKIWMKTWRYGIVSSIVDMKVGS